jgi:2-dehydro-3-deoxygluconokinase
MAKIVTLGEIMLRLSTPGQKRFVQSEKFDIVYGGGEANVAVSLAQFGHDAYFVTKLPKHEIGQAAIYELSKYQVHTDYIARITPAISKKAAELTKIALISAKKHGVKVSVDLNYRKKLWTPEEAQQVMKPLMQYVDVCIGNEEDAELVLGFKPKNVDVSKGHLDLEAYKTIFKEMKEAFGFEMVATTLRESFSATKNGWQALLYDGQTFYPSKSYLIDPIIDRVGGGDSFSAGLIHGLLTKTNDQAIEFAVAASALKHTIPGDFNMVSESEVEALQKGDQSGRVQR